MMERLYEILEDIQPGVNYKECENLIDGHFLDSLSIIALVAELEDEYDILFSDRTKYTNTLDCTK